MKVKTSSILNFVRARLPQTIRTAARPRTTITAAIADAATAGVAGRIYIESGTFTESITISNFKVDLMLLGGWDVAANTKVGTSTINGAVNVTNSSGIITFDNLIFTNPITVTSSKVVVKGTTSNDAIQVNLVGANNVVNVDGGGGGDAVTINLGGSGTVNVNDTGSSGTDSVVVNGTPNADTVSVSSNAITRAGGEAVNISGIETLAVNVQSDLLLGGEIVFEKQLALVSERGNIFQSGGTLVAEHLLLDAGGDLTLNGDVIASGGNILLNAGGDIVQNVGVDVSASGVGGIAYTAGKYSSTGAIYIYGNVTAEQGGIYLTAPNGVTLGDGAAVFTRGVFIVDADSDNDGTGAYIQPPSSSVSVVNNTVSITAADVDLGGTLDSGTGDIVFTPSTLSATIGLGGNILFGLFSLLEQDFAIYIPPAR